MKKALIFIGAYIATTVTLIAGSSLIVILLCILKNRTDEVGPPDNHKSRYNHGYFDDDDMFDDMFED